MDKQNICITTIPMGENRTLFVPLDKDGQSCTALGFFVKDTGAAFKEIIMAEDVHKHIKDTTPIVAFNFKNKKSITALIKFLRFYRDNLYKKDFSKLQEVK